MDEACRGIGKKLMAGLLEVGFGGGSARFSDVKREEGKGREGKERGD